MKGKLEYRIFLLGFITLVAGIFLASLIVIRIERNDVHIITRDRLVSTAGIITASIELTMLDGNAEVSRELVRELKATSGFDLFVYNWEGREAFNPNAEVVEDESLKKVTATGRQEVATEGGMLKVYLPLPNKSSCRGCHAIDRPVIGAVETAISLENEHRRMSEFMFYVIVVSLLSILIIGGVLWLAVRRGVILPLQDLEKSAMKMAGGDLCFKTGITSWDEIGRLDVSIKDSLTSISRILRRVKDISGRISSTADTVESESDKVMESTTLESEAVEEISGSVEELNSAITEIAESIQELSRSMEETAGSIQKMSRSIDSVTDLTHNVSDGVDASSSSIEELSATIGEVAGNAANLARVSNETLSAVETIIDSVKEVESSAKESARLSEKVATEASTYGVTSINKTKEGMDVIKKHVSTAAEVIERLGGRSEEIGNIVNVIEDIADQTSLLALNAAILASQSGEYGKGFSVVANEIKDLSERTVFSTKEIDGLVNTVRQEVAQAVEAMGEGMKSVEQGIRLSKEATGALTKILETSKKSSGMSDSIKRSTAEQARTARYVSEAIERMRGIIEEIAKATADQARGANMIIRAADKIRDASHQADRTTEQQAAGSKQIAQAVEGIANAAQKISSTIQEQKSGANRIWSSVQKIKHIPGENRELSFRINKALRELLSDAELISMEMERFRLYEPPASNDIRMGIVPFEPPADLYRRFMPLATYLCNKTGRKFELQVAPDIDTAIAELEQGITHLCLMSSLAYTRACKDGGARLMVQAMADGTAFHHGAIVTREDSQITSVKDLTGKSFAFVDIHSASGHLVPMSMLLEEGVSLESLSYYHYLGSHVDVAKAVLKGDFDAGGVMESTANNFRDEGLRILKVSGEIPLFNISSGPSMSEKDREAVLSALLALSEGSIVARDVLGAAGSKLSGFSAASDDVYNSIRELASRMGEY